jgi:hypothetical protein
MADRRRSERKEGGWGVPPGGPCRAPSPLISHGGRLSRSEPKNQTSPSAALWAQKKGGGANGNPGCADVFTTPTRVAQCSKRATGQPGSPPRGTCRKPPTCKINVAHTLCYTTPFYHSARWLLVAGADFSLVSRARAVGRLLLWPGCVLCFVLL